MPKNTLEFTKRLDTETIEGFSLGRITLGLEGPTVRIVLFPDGVHIFVPQEGERFVHMMGRPIPYRDSQ